MQLPEQQVKQRLKARRGEGGEQSEHNDIAIGAIGTQQSTAVQPSHELDLTAGEQSPPEKGSDVQNVLSAVLQSALLCGWCTEGSTLHSSSSRSLKIVNMVKSLILHFFLSPLFVPVHSIVCC